jgi:D-3-phosphoglycerate dehydrogenase
MNILANDGVSQDGVNLLEDNGHTVIQKNVAQDQLAEFMNENEIHVLLVRSATKVRKELIDQVEDLKIIGRGGVGLDNIDVDYAESKGMKVINTPAASSESVADLVIGHMFSGIRFLKNANREMPLEGESNFKKLKKSYAKGTEAAGKTFGIIGFGRIGQALAKRAIGLGMKVIAYDKFIDEAKVQLEFFNGQSVDFTIKTTDFNSVITESDVISLHVPAQKEYIIGKTELEKMKSDAGIINTARGGIIDEKALVKALDEDKLGYAALDVFENEPTPAVKLLMNPKLSLSPHIGGATVEAQSRIGVELAEQILALDKS